MEAGDGFNKDKNYRVPLTVFQAIQIQKMNDRAMEENQFGESKMHKKEEAPKDFFFPINTIF